MTHRTDHTDPYSIKPRPPCLTAPERTVTQHDEPHLDRRALTNRETTYDAPPYRDRRAETELTLPDPAVP